MDRQASSLDRFLRNRAPVLLGMQWRTSAAVNGAIGGALMGAGLAMMGAAVIARQPELLGGGTGPLTAGAINLWVAMIMRKRAARIDAPTVKLSDESKAFLHKVMRQAFGWRYTWVGWDSNRSHRSTGRRRGHLRAALWGATDATLDQRLASEILAPDVFALLEEAAQHYNRIQGCLAAAESDGGAALKKMRPAIVEAADETIAEVLHHAAMMEKYPESNTQGARIAAQRVAALREAADRVEALQAREPSLMERMSRAGAMDSVLEDLRLEQIARAELQSPDETRGEHGQSGS